jgi:hypothetical protein
VFRSAERCPVRSSEQCGACVVTSGDKADVNSRYGLHMHARTCSVGAEWCSYWCICSQFGDSYTLTLDYFSEQTTQKRSSRNANTSWDYGLTTNLQNDREPTTLCCCGWDSCSIFEISRPRISAQRPPILTCVFHPFSGHFQVNIAIVL